MSLKNENEGLERSGRLETKSRIFKDRKRTNVLRKAEQSAISYLVARMPAFITPNVLTGIGSFGGLVVLLGFYLGALFDRSFLLLGILGLAINWFGDSLDGRIAYYRNIPRKWYGFSLDIIMDWINTVMMGFGFLIYLTSWHELLAYFFVALYGWAMIISQLRYKITDKYTIDAGALGPTEVRFIVAFIIVMEVVVPKSLNYFSILIVVVLFIVNISDTMRLLKLGDERDREEKSAKREKERNEKSAV
ncbi:CDP-alcohol phosphatidyltransferase family protein [Olivibacter sitiensis]|uniref:CDP-alcohol phosphatidyltransferase family protein n=1 Tax=Olivibacter sitiensis TaxID=376470 RepID=UPI0003FE5D0A|nr:CDP-alcohol phosphatidyltransferase family protein [Olivibacter sitiensis]